MIKRRMVDKEINILATIYLYAEYRVYIYNKKLI